MSPDHAFWEFISASLTCVLSTDINTLGGGVACLFTELAYARVFCCRWSLTAGLPWFDPSCRGRMSYSKNVDSGESCEGGDPLVSYGEASPLFHGANIYRGF